MSIIADFVAELRSIPDVLTFVSQRIYPLIDKGDTLPSIVYNTRGGVRESYIRDSFGLRETFIQMDLYTEDYAQLDTLRDAIAERFNGFVGAFNAAAMSGGTTVSSCQIVTTRDTLETQNPVVYRTTIELNILST